VAAACALQNACVSVCELVPSRIGVLPPNLVEYCAVSL
jgi:hypothetical protein